MKILFDNKIIDSVITSLHEDANYPATNLYHEFLWTRYQAIGKTDTITIPFDVDISASCFFYSYNNLTQIIVRFYDLYDTLLYTETINTVYDVDAVYFPLVEDVNYIQIDVSTDQANAYLGGCAFGLEEDFGSVFSVWDDVPIDNSVVTDSDSGQTLQNYSAPLMGYNFSFYDIDNDDKLYFQALYKSKGIGGKIWADPFEENHDYMEPLYSTIRSVISPIKNGRRFNISLLIREAR